MKSSHHMQYFIIFLQQQKTQKTCNGLERYYIAKYQYLHYLQVLHPELFTVFLVGGFVNWCLLPNLHTYWKEKSFLLNPSCWKWKSYFLTLNFPHGEEKENI